MKTKMEKLKTQHEEELEIRRDKLAELLMKEEKQYEQEFFANLETPEQVRQKMTKRLQELRSKRTTNHEDEVKKLKDRQFKESKNFLYIYNICRR